MKVVVIRSVVESQQGKNSLVATWRNAAKHSRADVGMGDMDGY